MTMAVRSLAGGEQFPAAAQPLLQGVAGRVHDLGLPRGQLVRGHASAETAEPLGARRDVLRAGDVADPGVPERDQVGDRRPHARLAVRRDRREGIVLRGAVHQHHGHVGLGRLGEDGAAGDRGRQHEPVHVPGAHLVEDELFLGQVGVGVAEQRDVTAGGEPVLKTAHDRREQRVVEVGDQHADGVRAAGPQAARHRVGPVAEPVGRLADPARGLLADQEPGSRVQRAGRGGRVHPRCRGHVPQRGRAVMVGHRVPHLSGGIAGRDLLHSTHGGHSPLGKACSRATGCGSPR